MLTVSPPARVVPVEFIYKYIGLDASLNYKYNNSATSNSVTAGTIWLKKIMFLIIYLFIYFIFIKNKANNVLFGYSHMI